MPLFHKGADSRLRIRRVESTDLHEKASFLVQKMYGWRGYETDFESPTPNSLTVAAEINDKTLATITVNFDSPDGLAVTSLYPEQVDSLVSQGARVCEFTRLAVDRTEHSKDLLAMIFHVAYVQARLLHGRTDLLIEVNPRHARYYSRMLGFRCLGPKRLCPRVNADAVLMWLPLQHAGDQIARHAGQRRGDEIERSLYPQFFSLDHESAILERLRATG